MAKDVGARTKDSKSKEIPSARESSLTRSSASSGSFRDGYEPGIPPETSQGRSIAQDQANRRGNEPQPDRDVQNASERLVDDGYRGKTKGTQNLPIRRYACILLEKRYLSSYPKGYVRPSRVTTAKRALTRPRRIFIQQ